MKFINNKFIKIVILLSAVFICDLLYFTFIKYSYNNEIKLQLMETTNQMETKVRYAINTQDVVSETIFKQIINKPNILELFSKAYKSDEATKKEIRKKLYLSLSETYDYLKKMDIKQLQFHLPNNESFLRFHSPEKWGDDLTKDRYSVKMANREKRVYQGFETGKISDGFRYIFPLEYNNEHIGTVETGFSIEAVKKQMEQMGVNYLSFILKKDMISDTVFKDKQNIYRKSIVSKEYVVEDRNLETLKNVKYEMEKIKLNITSDMTKLLEKNRSFSIYSQKGKDYYIISFISVKSVDGNPAAYIMAYEKDKSIYEHLIWLKYATIIGLILIPMIIIFIFLYIEKNRKIIEQNRELKKSEQNLKISEENFRTFFNTIDDMIFIGNKSGEIFFVNNAVIRKLGYTMEEMKVMHILDVHPEEKKEEAAQIFADMFEGKLDKCPLPLSKKDGSYLPVETRVWFGKWDEKECVFGISKDLSKEEENRQKFDKIFNNNPALMAISTVDKREFTDVNKVFIEKLGYSKEEIIGKTAIDLQLFVQYEKQAIVREKLLKDGKIYNEEIKIRKKSGDIIDCYFSGEILESQGKKYFLSVMIDITEQKKAEESIKVQNGLINSLLDSIPDIIFFKDKEGVYLGCNPSFIELVGKRKDEIVGKTDYDLFDKETAHFFRKQDIRMLGILAARHNEEWITYPDGSKKLLDTLKTPYWGKDGELIGILGISRDITKRKEAEEKLRKSEEQLQMTFDVTGEGIWDWDIVRKEVKHNKRWCQILGLDDSALNHTMEFFGNCIFEEDREEVMKKVNEAIKKSENYESEHRMVNCKGEIVWVHDRGAVVERDESGNPIRMIGSIADITNRKNAEQEVKKITDRLSLATRAGTIGIWDYDVVNNILTWDEQMYKLYGITDKEFIGVYEAWKNGLHPEDLERADKEIEKALIGEKEFDTEFRVVWSDKTIRYLKAIARVIRNNEGKPIQMIGVNWDITAFKQMEMKLLAAKEQAESANKAKSEFLANMSHEIRTPMNAILGFSEILQDEISDRKSLEYLKGINIAGKNLLNLINDILDLSKIEAGKMELQFEKFNMNIILNELTQIFHIKAKEKGIEISVNYDKNMPSVILIDELRIKQVLFNLIGNAIKFTEKGYVKISAELINKIEKEKKIDMCINVLDSGIGIAKGQEKKIFESFTQQDGQSTRKYGGTGLGLAISQKLAKMMGGEIEVENIRQGGSKFMVKLKNITYFEENEIAEDKLIDENIDYQFEKATILIAEDTPVNVEVVKGMLMKYNFTILVSENGADAVEKAKKYHPNLILMDIQMPIMNGYEATEILKRTEMTKDIKIVALTASAMIEHEEKIRKICDGYLKKPVKKIELLKELSKHLESKIVEKNKLEKIREEQKISKEIKEILKEKYYSEWKEIEKFVLGNEVEEFARKLKKEAEEYNSKELYEYAEKLMNYAMDFDIEKMEQQFKMFEKIISEV